MRLLDVERGSIALLSWMYPCNVPTPFSVRVLNVGSNAFINNVDPVSYANRQSHLRQCV